MVANATNQHLGCRLGRAFAAALIRARELFCPLKRWKSVNPAKHRLHSLTLPAAGQTGETWRDWSVTNVLVGIVDHRYCVEEPRNLSRPQV
jgi:hypothetical protein